MIKWYEDLYLDNNVTKNVRKYMKKIEKARPVYNVFCIALASNENNVFDIINANELLFPYYKRQNICIIGLALGRDSAFEMVREIIEEMYENTGGFCAREYFCFS